MPAKLVNKLKGKVSDVDVSWLLQFEFVLSTTEIILYRLLHTILNVMLGDNKKKCAWSICITVEPLITDIPKSGQFI